MNQRATAHLRRPAPGRRETRREAAAGKGPVDLRLLRLARPQAPRLVWLVALSVLHALTVVAAALAAARTVVQVLAGQDWAPSILALGAALLVRAVVAALLPGAAHRVSTAVISAVRRTALERIARRGPAWVAGRAARSEPVEVAALVATGLDPLRPWFATYLPSLVVAAVLPPTVLVLMALVDPASALIVLLTLPLVPVFAALVGWATQHRARSQYARGGHLAGHFLDVVRGLVTLKLVDRANRQVEAVRDSSQHYARATTRVLSVAFLSSTALDLVATISVGLVAVGAGVRLAGGEMVLWPALAVILLAPEAYRPLREAGAQFHESAQASAVLDRLAELDGVPVPAPGGGEPVAAPGDGEVEAPRVGRGSQPSTLARTLDLDGSRPTVGARGLRVRYPGRNHEVVLPDFTVSAGELLAVVGPSGAGKTTLLRVLAGAHHPDQGTAWADEAHFVPQRPALPLARTVREALDDTDRSEMAVVAVLTSVGLATSELPEGLDTALGDDGTGLSAGQLHRLALARAILAVTGPGAPARPVLLLDEPTAHLDPDTESAVVAALRRLSTRGITIVAAAHRSALIEAADRQILLDSAGIGACAGEPAEANRRVDGRPTAPRTSQDPTAADRSAPEPGRPLLAGLRHRWAAMRPSGRFILAAIAGAASLLSGIGLTVAASWMIVRAEAQPPILSLSMAVVAVRAFAIARPLWSYAQRLAAHDAGLSLLAHWRAQVVTDLLPRVPGRLSERRGRLLTRVVEDVDLRLSGIIRGAVPLGAAVLTLTVVAGGLVWLAPAALVPLAGAVAITVAVATWAVRADRRNASARDAARAELQDAVVGSVENTDELASSGGPGLFAAVRGREQRAEAAERGAARTEGRSRGMAEVGAAALVVGLAVVAAGAWGAGALSAETVGIVVLAGLVLSETVLWIVPAAREGVAGAAARDRLSALRSPSAVVDPAGRHDAVADIVALQQSAGSAGDTVVAGASDAEAEWRASRTLARAGPGVVAGAHSAGDLAPGGALVVTDLTLRWDTAAPVNKAVLRAEPGHPVVIEGASGTGKSTLAAALVGLLSPTAGRISLDGMDLGQVPGRQWRRQVGLAGDPDHIFATTVRQNLLLAHPDADDDALELALDQAHLGSWLRGLTDGLDTWLDSGGRILSGGERRRFVIARAVLRDPQVLILDEPTEGLDADTARALVTDLLGWARSNGRVLVIFTHRLDGLEQVGERYRLHDGRIRAQQVLQET